MTCHIDDMDDMDDKLWHRQQIMANKDDIDFKREQGTQKRTRKNTSPHQVASLG